MRNVGDVSEALSAGADKVVINTGAVRDIKLIEQVAQKFGSQCLVGSIEAKKSDAGWNAYIDNGRERTTLDVLEWAWTLESAGCGEILLTSVDQEGTGRGFDVELVKQINNAVQRPVIVSGGYGKPQHLHDLLGVTQPSAVAFAATLHYQRSTVDDLRGAVNSCQVQST